MNARRRSRIPLLHPFLMAEWCQLNSRHKKISIEGLVDREQTQYFHETQCISDQPAWILEYPESRREVLYMCHDMVLCSSVLCYRSGWLMCTYPSTHWCWLAEEQHMLTTNFLQRTSDSVSVISCSLSSHLLWWRYSWWKNPGCVTTSDSEQRFTETGTRCLTSRCWENSLRVADVDWICSLMWNGPTVFLLVLVLLLSFQFLHRGHF